MISVDKCKNGFSVSQNKKEIGNIYLYENGLHNENIYLKLNFSVEDDEDCKELFTKIRNITEKPLQVMISSAETDVTKTLLRGGFLLKRKCYEIESGKADYLGKNVKSDLKYAFQSDKNYDICCHLIYEHYLDTHKNINPWTAGYEAFCAELPETVYFNQNENGIENLAFIEENEIAYVCGNTDTFISFAEKLVSALFEKYETVCFESDDCDEIAMELKSLFNTNSEPSFDTYVYNG